MLLIEKEKSSTEYFQPNTDRINSWASRLPKQPGQCDLSIGDASLPGN
jgi:hypothetical protein